MNIIIKISINKKLKYNNNSNFCIVSYKNITVQKKL